MTCKVLVALLLCGLFSLTAPAQPAQESIGQLTEKLRISPTDNTRREQLIKLAIETKPAIPETARRSFVQGNVIFKDAKDAAGQHLAIAAFKDAVKAAPWWGEAYYNLAMTQELVGAFADARDSLSWYIKTKPGEKEERAAQDKIYAIEAREALAKTTADTAAAREEAKKREAAEQERLRFEKERADREAVMRSLDGAIFTTQFTDAAGTVTAWFEMQTKGGRVALTSRGYGEKWGPWEYCILDSKLECKTSPNAGGYVIWVKISSDGRRATNTTLTPRGTTGQVIEYMRKN